MEQRSKEWFEARKGRITASNVGAILGVDPHRSREDVLRMMVRDYYKLEPEFKGNVATEWGIANEETAIFEYELQTGNITTPATFITMGDRYGATPDRHVGNSGILEVKCPYGIRTDVPPVFKTINQQMHYYAQVQFQIAVTSVEWADFFQWTPHGHHLERVEKNHTFVANMMSQLEDFWTDYLNALENPEQYLGEKMPELDTPAAHQLMRHYIELRDAEEQAKEKRKEVLDQIVAMAGSKPCKFAGHSLIKVEKEGAISYAKAVKELLPKADLEPWRGKPSTYWMIK